MRGERSRIWLAIPPSCVGVPLTYPFSVELRLTPNFSRPCFHPGNLLSVFPATRPRFSPYRVYTGGMKITNSSKYLVQEVSTNRAITNGANRRDAHATARLLGPGFYVYNRVTRRRSGD